MTIKQSGYSAAQRYFFQGIRSQGWDTQSCIFELIDNSIDEEDPRISFSFSGVQNTSRAGTSHPIVYGEIVTGSVVISAGIDTHQVSA